jgi:hypothetical protein
VLAEAWQVLLRPIPSLHCLFEELASKVEGFLESELAFALKGVDRVVWNGFGLGLLFAIGEDVVVPTRQSVTVQDGESIVSAKGTHKKVMMVAASSASLIMGCDQTSSGSSRL